MAPIAPDPMLTSSQEQGEGQQNSKVDLNTAGEPQVCAAYILTCSSILLSRSCSSSYS